MVRPVAPVTNKPVRSRRRQRADANIQRLSNVEESNMGRGILLWLLGVPIPIIILLALFFHH